jgi:agmatinase
MEENHALGFTTLSAAEFDDVGVAGALKLAAPGLRSPAYVSVDIDVLDPAYAPGTGTPQAAGLTSRELLAVLRGVAGPDLDMVGGDVVELSPPYDPTGATAFAAANAAYHMIGLAARASRARE